MTGRPRTRLLFAAVPIWMAGWLGCAPAPGSSPTPASMEAEGMHPCATRQLNNGWQDQAIPYDAELSASDEFASIQGWVFDLEGNPLNTAIVVFTPRDSTAEESGGFTGEDGSFHIAGVPSGRGQVSVREPGFLRQIHDVLLLPGRTDTLCVALRYRGMLLPDF